MSGKTNTSELDILEIIKAVKDSKFGYFRIKSKGVEIELKDAKEVEEVKEVSYVPGNYTQPTVKPKELEEDDSMSLSNRIRNMDESLLYELDYDPDLKCDLLENNIIQIADNGEYKYVEEPYAKES